MKGAIVGLGRIGFAHLMAYEGSESLQIIAIADARGEGARATATNPNLRFYSRVEDLLEGEELDFVDICTPPSSHVAYISAAVDRGIHVLCQKPIVHTDDALNSLICLLAAARTVVFPAHNYRFAPGLCRLREIVRNPSFGSILDVRFRTLRAGHARGISAWDADWRRRHVVSGGGILRDHGPHSLYVLRFLLGLSVREVSCLVGQFGASNPAWGEPRVEDSAVIRLRLDEGVEAQLDLTWATNRRESEYRIQGANETATLRDDDLLRYTSHQRLVERVTSDFNDPAHTSWNRALLSEFSAAVHVNSPGVRRAAAERAVQEALDVSMAYRSARANGAWIVAEDAARLLALATPEPHAQPACPSRKCQREACS